MIKNPDKYTMSPQERVFRSELRHPLVDLVELFTGDRDGPTVHTYSELVERARNLLAGELERIGAAAPKGDR
jgi:hypothetical protein